MPASRDRNYLDPSTRNQGNLRTRELKKNEVVLAFCKKLTVDQLNRGHYL